MNDETDTDRWARLRFAIIGRLLAAPPPKGQLKSALLELASRTWSHPNDGTRVQFSFTTLERWYYQARQSNDPVAALRRQRREDAGRPRRLSPQIVKEIESLYRLHPGWTVQLHHDNLVALASADRSLGEVPSYATVRRYFHAQGYRRRRSVNRQSPGMQKAIERVEQREVRSYEVDYVNGLWHTDFHHGSRRVLLPDGQWITPLLLGVIDDHSRLICHLQWYVDETSETLMHGLSQALQKRGLPRALMSDNGAAMQSDELRSGLHTLGIVLEYTLPYSPYQNGKKETFWSTLEGRLMAMLEGVADLTLARLNEITQVWVEQDYHQRHHREIGTTPLKRFLNSPNVSRECPDSARLRQAFRRSVERKQRRSDGTISLAGQRFEIPNRYRHIDRPRVRYARWDLTNVELLDPHSPTSLCALYPVDKSANADGLRRTLTPLGTDTDQTTTSSDEPVNDTQALPPLLRQLLEEFAATGLPPAYLPKSVKHEDTETP